MIAPVDVLEVLQTASDVLFTLSPVGQRSPNARALDEARDAVAELIEAAKGVSAESMRERDGNDTLYLRIAELEIALAKVQP